MTRANESYLLNAIIRAAYPFMLLYRVNVGRVKTADGRWFSTGVPKGHPDLHGDIPARFTRHGHAVPVYVEAKVYPNRPTPEQLEFIRKKREDGCVAGVCYSVADFWRLVGPVLKLENGDLSEDGEDGEN